MTALYVRVKTVDDGKFKGRTRWGGTEGGREAESAS